MKLYEIAEAHRQAFDDLNDMFERGEIDEHTVEDSLAALGHDFNEKGVSCIAHLKNLQAQAGAISEALKDLTARKRRIESQIESFKDYIRHNMEVCGITKIESPLFSASLGKGRPVVQIDDESLVPDRFKKTTVSIDKRAINAALDEGMIDGVSVVDGKSRLTIK